MLCAQRHAWHRLCDKAFLGLLSPTTPGPHASLIISGSHQRVCKTLPTASPLSCPVAHRWSQTPLPIWLPLDKRPRKKGKESSALSSLLLVSPLLLLVFPVPWGAMPCSPRGSDPSELIRTLPPLGNHRPSCRGTLVWRPAHVTLLTGVKHESRDEMKDYCPWPLHPSYQYLCRPHLHP